MGAVLDQLEHVKARIRAKVEHPFRVIKRQFGHVKVRYRGCSPTTPATKDTQIESSGSNWGCICSTPPPAQPS